MKAPTTRDRPAPRRRALQRRRGPGGGCVWCSCCRLPAKHTQWVGLDLSFVVNHRQPVGVFMQRPEAFRALPDDLQASVLDGKPCAQTSGAGKSDIAVRGVAFRAGSASGAASNGSAKPVPVWTGCGLMASAAMGAHVAACSRGVRSTAQSTSGRMSSQRTAPLVARSMAGQCSAGTFPRNDQLQTVCTDLPMALAKEAGPPEISIARVSAFMSQ